MAASLAGQEGDRTTDRRFHRLSRLLVTLRTSEREARCHRPPVPLPTRITPGATCPGRMVAWPTTGSHTRDSRKKCRGPASLSSRPAAFGISGRPSHCGEAPASGWRVPGLRHGFHNANTLGVVRSAHRSCSGPEIEGTKAVGWQFGNSYEQKTGVNGGSHRSRTSGPSATRIDLVHFPIIHYFTTRDQDASLARWTRVADGDHRHGSGKAGGRASLGLRRSTSTDRFGGACSTRGSLTARATGERASSSDFANDHRVELA